MAGLHEVDVDTTLVAKVDALIRKLDLLVSSSQGASLNSRVDMFCKTYRRGHGEASAKS